ncbi:MAG: capsular polysaccharide biosynthesis protein CapF [Clostridia bacterium]|nr:capsular polysaccharide biosynthesis protein CapF [Clostridia bacterium]
MSMNVLITGADGFVGRNLAAALMNIRDGKDRTHPDLKIDKIYLYDIHSTESELDEACESADFVFNLAGVNRPKDTGEFMAGNFGFAEKLLCKLKKYNNTCPVMLSSSIQATLEGRFAGSEYAKSKKAGEDLFFGYAEEVGARVLVYRLPNLFGKWCRPNYNSVVATFCHNLARDLPIEVSDPNVELELLYIDDLVGELILALEGREHRAECGRLCTVPTTHRVTLGRIVELIESFKAQPSTLLMPNIPSGSFDKKLYSTYLSYLPKEKVSIPLDMKSDARGSFTEILRTVECGQFSVNISKPGVTKGEHWHNTKWELFIVVSGRALIRQRKIGDSEVLTFEVSGERVEAVHMLPGYTHSITNLSDTEDLVTLMWANECFDPARPDTFYEVVE